MKKLAIILLLTAFSFAGKAQFSPGVNHIVVHTTSKSPVYGWNNEDSLQGEVILPSDWNTNPTRKYPVIVNCHGSGTQAANYAASSLTTLNNDGGLLYDVVNGGVSYENIVNPKNPNDKQSFIIFALQSWNDQSQDCGEFPSNYRWIMANLGSRVDTNRIFLTGLSAGAAEVFESILYQDSIWKHYKGVVSFSTPIGWQANYDSVMLKRAGFRVWVLIGTSDNAYTTPPDMQGVRDTLNKHDPGQLDFTTFAGGHCCWTTHYNTTYIDPVLNMNVPQWMLANSISPIAPPSYLPIKVSSVNFNWMYGNYYDLTFTANNTYLDKEYDVQESDDGKHWKTIKVIQPDGDRVYEDTFDL